MNNYEKIKNMSIEEMAKFIYDYFSCEYCPMHTRCEYNEEDCMYKSMDWLQQEVSNEQK